MTTVTKTTVTRRCDRCGKEGEATSELWATLKCHVPVRFFQGDIAPGTAEDVDLCESCGVGFAKWMDRRIGWPA